MSQNNSSSSELEQLLLAHIPDTAQTVRASATPAEAQAAIRDIVALPTSGQLNIIKTLSKQQTSDAADILTALNTYAADKEVRKEARRGLVRLESMRIRSNWMPPIEQASVIKLNVSNPPRFWQGFVTQSREEGELQLLLWWEQGYDYSEVRTIGFLLDFWNEGVKDCFIEVGSKRATERRMDEMRARLANLSPTSCTLAEGKRLLEDALSVNTWKKTEPAQEFRTNRSLINQLILDATNIGEDSQRTFINTDLEDQEVVVNFLGAWSLGDYGLAYDLLTPDSSVRNGLDRDEWIERHRTWFDEAHPSHLELGFVHERERSQSTLWVPNPRLNISSRKDIEIGWSLELTDTPIAGTLREFPMGTAINKETGRHWFWNNFTLMRARDGWRVQGISDEGASVQALPVVELQHRIKEYEDAMDALLQKRDQDMTAFMQEAAWRLTQLLHFYDALIATLPLDRAVNEEAYNRSVLVGNPERSMIYLERLTQRFPENRANLQRQLGATLVGLAYNYEQNGLEQRRDAFLARGEAVLRESLTTQDSATGHMLLGELLLSTGRNDEAEQEMLNALTLSPTPEEHAAVEAGLGNVAMRRERIAEAISHYRRVTEIVPNYQSIWFNLGFAHRLLGQFDEAIKSYQRAIEQTPRDIRPYSDLAAIYRDQGEAQKARQVLEQGIKTVPESADLRAVYASFLFQIGDARGARRAISEAEEIDPSSVVVQNMRQYLEENAQKKR